MTGPVEAISSDRVLQVAIPLEADTKALRTALGSFATGVTIVTTRGPDGEDVGLTANSFSSVSLDPAMVLWSLAETSTNFAAFKAAEHFAVHVLASDQSALSTQFARKGGDKFAGIEVERSPDGIPLLRGCSARFDCRTAFQYKGGDHTIFVGEVISFDHTKRQPLVFHAGRYGMVFENEQPDAAPVDGDGDRLTPDDLLYHVSRIYFLLRQDALAERHRRGWTEDEYAALNILVREGGMAMSKLEALGATRGRRFTSELVGSLISQGLLTSASLASAEGHLMPTVGGRQEVIQMIAVLKARESEVLGKLDPSEVQLLKRLLRRVFDTQSA